VVPQEKRGEKGEEGCGEYFFLLIYKINEVAELFFKLNLFYFVVFIAII
jgi:hypothetical protein